MPKDTQEKPNTRKRKVIHNHTDQLSKKPTLINSMNCAVCNFPIGDISIVRCATCSLAHHIACVSITVEFLDYINKRNLPWLCFVCKLTEETDTRNKIDDLAATVSIKTDSLSQQVGAVSSAVDNIESRVETLEKAATDRQNDISSIRISAINFESTKLSKNLIFSGVPVTVDEDLKKIIKSIALQLNIVLVAKNLRKTIRLTSAKNTTSNPAPILVTFNESKVKSDLLEAYFDRIKKKQFITTSTFGILPDSRVYINLHLPRLLQVIQQRVVSLKKDGLIESFVVKPAVIRIKVQGVWHSVHAHEDIDKILKIDE